MKVGSRGDYGLRALAYLAHVAHTHEPVQIHTIARHQQIPEDYLRQLLVHLRLAGLVKSVRGPHGGYLLARPAADITMGEVIDILEGAIEPMACRHLDEGEEPCGLIAGCSIRAHWREATRQLNDVLRRTTLLALVQGNTPPASQGS